MSGIESIKENYSNESESSSDDEDFERLADDLIEVDEALELQNRKGTEIIDKLRSAYFKSASPSEVIHNVLECFDDKGGQLGIAEPTLEKIGDKIDSDVEDIVSVMQEAVIRLTVDSDSMAPKVRRRWNLHILAVIIQLREYDALSDQMETFLQSTFNNLCDHHHDWHELTSTEVDFMQNITKHLNDVSPNCKNLMCILLSNLCENDK